jgi:8-oxo-dGTP pyrophosphatase MutT (NUDIX family)
MDDQNLEPRRAAVALVVSPGLPGDKSGDELLLVRRAEYPGDPWSGHIALPGGGVEPVDGSLEDTARRETFEETGIDLGSSDCFAVLPPVAPMSRAAPAITVAPFVFRYAGDRRIFLSDEIVEAWWVPVAEFARPDAWQVATVTVAGGTRLAVRAFRLHGHILWGLTERVLDEFLTLLRTQS